MNRLSVILTKIFHWVFFILMVFLFLSSLFVTATHEIKPDGSIQEFAKVTVNNITLILALFLLGVFCCFSINWLIDLILKKKNVNTTVFVGVVCLVCFILSVLWVYTTCIIPGADQAFCIEYAIAMNNGDYSCLEKGGYLANYPYLMGYVGFLRLIFNVFGDGSYDAYKYFNALCIPLMIFSGYKVTGSLSGKSKKAELIYLFLMFFCFPAYIYVVFVYGDLAAPCFGMLSIWMFLELLKDAKPWKYLILFLSVFASVLLRKNAMIFAIAMLIVLVVRMLGKIELKECLIMLTIILSLVFTNLFVDAVYLPQKVDKTASVPSIACIAMGLNNDGGFAGWYNYYELNIHYDNGCDSQLTKEAAWNDIKEVFIPFLWQNKKNAVNFFFNKINSQWQSPMYQSIVSTNLLYGLQNSFTISVYRGAIGKFMEYFMKVYQMLMYGTVMLLLWKSKREKNGIEQYVSMIAVFGGFLLTVFWEAKGRYVLPYFLILIPVFAFGQSKLFEKL